MFNQIKIRLLTAGLFQLYALFAIISPVTTWNEVREIMEELGPLDE